MGRSPVLFTRLLVNISGYTFEDADLNPSHDYLFPTVLRILESVTSSGPPKRLFELGCGSGVVANELHKRGYDLVGVDPSQEGIRIAKRAFPDVNLHEGSTEDDLAARFGTFPIVLSLEVIEHVYAPRQFARCVANLLAPGGLAIISTPYHGYFKNLTLAVTGKLDAHFTALWDNGHIKFWSIKTLRQLLVRAGFQTNMEFIRVGRIPPLAKSMIAIARKGK